MMSERRVTVSPADGCFDHLVVYLVALQSFIHAIEVYNTGAAQRWPANDTIVLDAKQAGIRLTFAPLDLLTTVCLSRKPDILHLTEVPQQIDAEAQLNLGAIEPLLFSFGQAMVTNYFEKHRDEIEGIFTEDPARWPSIWNFGRVIRNAMSHGGRLAIRSRNADAVTWRKLAYEHSDNGRQILHTDIWPGDLVCLLREMDATRRRADDLGAE